jgi:hypothetical protein
MGKEIRTVRLLKLLMFSVLLGASALLYAQDEKPQEEPKAKQEEPKKPDEAKPAKPDKQDEKMQKQEQKQMQKEGQSAQPETGKPAQAGNARPAGKHGQIPDDKFRASFGRSHSFKAQTVIVSGQTQFQYSGYSFQLVDAWPAGWAYTDDCYIDYIDGEYFLFDLLHPGVRIAVIVMM